ncbi:hypothetical protein C7W88_19535 (plasmid) [Novosphingobium sp. THN1]|nr:hypothetical protein C7W88_07955 [Novosphingobium sp. THN1]AXU21148.1 hypothetical protein C7W88_19535 [Novosphingobium sp. THN1]MBA4087621.1 hypothetical protein [Novosphingobium sp.]
MIWLIGLTGAMLVAWAGYQFIRLLRCGEISAMHYLRLDATIDDPPAWLWLIALVNGAYGVLGLVMMADALSS